MINLVKIHKEIGSFEIVENNLYAVENSHIIKFDLNGTFQKDVILLENYWGVIYYKKFFHVYTSRSQNRIYDYDGNKILEKNDFNFYNIESVNNFLGFDRKQKKVIYSKSDFIYEKKIANFCYIGESLFFTDINETNLKKYNIINSSLCWRLDLSKFGDYINIINESKPYIVKHFIDIYNKTLIVQLSNARIIGLNEETGELIFDLELNKIISLQNDNYLQDITPLYLSNNKLIWLNKQALIHIDLKIFKPELIKDFSIDERKNQWRFMSFTLKDDKIYFTGDYGWEYVTASRVGVMDANTGDVLWQTQLKKTGGLPEAPKVSGDKIYVRTVNNELYIFERGILHKPL
jgi:outer membrane protein assembly factor BamB